MPCKRYNQGEGIGGWTTASCSRSHGVSLWIGISKVWPKFERCISWQLGKGNRILFWKHKWLLNGCLAEAFPVIFSIAADQYALISDYYTVDKQWIVHLRRNVNDWELENYLQLMQLLNSITWINSEDRMVWKQSQNERFDVRSFYNALKGDVSSDFNWIKLWNPAIPSRVIFFAWCAAKGKILTIDNLQLRGHYLVNRCPLCQCREETIDHLFIHCSWSAEIWYFVLSCFGIQSCHPKDLKSLLMSWWGQPLAKHKKKVWNLVPLCLIWNIWKERNRRIFEDEQRSVVRFKSLFFSCLFNWANVGHELDLSSIMFFMDSLGKT